MVLDAQPRALVATHYSLLASLLERAWAADDERVADGAAALLASVHAAFPLGSPSATRESTHVASRAHELMSASLSAAANGLTPAGTPFSLGDVRLCKATL